MSDDGPALPARQTRQVDPRTVPLQREAHLEWARRAAADRLPGVRWVELNPDPGAEAYRTRRTRRGQMYFRQLRSGRVLPPTMLENIAKAEVRGGATLLQALTLSYAIPEWLIRTRGLLWTELTPVPSLLAELIEAYGISPEVHRADDQRLLRLRARLPAWHRRRGAIDEALRLLTEAVGEPPTESLTGVSAQQRRRAPAPPQLTGPVADPAAPPPAAEPGPDDAMPGFDDRTDPGGAAAVLAETVTQEPITGAPFADEGLGAEADETESAQPTVAVEEPGRPAVAARPSIHGLETEILACRDLEWYRRRVPRGQAPSVDLRIDGGFVHFQPPHAKPFRLIREDVRVGWTPGTPLSPLAPRLLPPWACYRIVVEGAEPS